MTEKRTLYYGPPIGIYDPRAFDTFVRSNVVDELLKIGSKSACSVEVESASSTMYHFPLAGIGLRYMAPTQGRCIVEMLGTRKKEMDDITRFIFETDNN